MGGKYNIIVFCTLFSVLLGTGAYVSRVDPYWLFSRSPSWCSKWEGHNRVLDINMRFSKSLEVVFRQPRAVIIGSSRVYRGMATDSQDLHGVYNLGVSSLRIREADAYLKHVFRWTPVSEVVFGLDYFMFDHDRASEAGFDPSLSAFKYIFKAVPSSLLTSMAMNDALLAQRGEHRGDGHWTYSGYKRTNPRTAEQVTRVLQSFYNKPMRATRREYEYLRSIIDTAQAHGVKLRFFISPLNERMLARMNEFRELSSFRQWKQNVKAIMRKHNVEIRDFSESNPYFRDDTEAGSTQYWIDTSHYSPVIGRWILKETGFI